MKISDMSSFSIEDLNLGQVPEGDDILNDLQYNIQSITDFNLWNRALSTDEMVNWTSCVNPIIGNVIDWNTSKWKSSKMHVENTTRELICKGIEDTFVAEKAISFQDSLIKCKAFKGDPLIVKNESIQNKAMDLAKQHECPNGKIISPNSEEFLLKLIQYLDQYGMDGLIHSKMVIGEVQ